MQRENDNRNNLLQGRVYMLCIGLFLHVGFSVVERDMIQRNSNLRLDSEVMLYKLTALLHDPHTSRNNQVSKPAGNNL